MRIVIYGINFSPELTGTGKYTGEMANWLARQGHEVRVITAPPYYPEWKIMDGYRNFYSISRLENLSVIRCPLFVPSQPSAVKRILHLLSFSISSFFPMIGCSLWRPDIVIQIVPTLLCSFQTLVVCKLFGFKSVLHIQDFEVDAMFGLSLAESRGIKKIAHWIEGKILSRYEFVSTISEGMLDRASSKGVNADRLVFFPNWAEVDRFKHQKKDKDFLRSLGIDLGKKVVLYSGNLGEKQGLELILFAADLLRERSDIHFLVVGKGVYRNKLESLAEDLELPNVSFFSLFPYETLPKLLASADCHLVVQKSGIADAVLPSKLTNILAVGGNAVITASPSTTLGILCEDLPGIAVLAEPESVESLASGIDLALSFPVPNHIARSYAESFLDKEFILRRFINEIT